jgi:hypothetical protein
MNTSRRYLSMVATMLLVVSSLSVAAASSSALASVQPPTVTISSFNPTSAVPGDVVTIYGSGFGLGPTGSFPSTTQGFLYLTDVTNIANGTQNWGQSGNGSTLVIDSWSSTQITFTVPVPSGPASQYRLQNGTTAKFCIAAYCSLSSGSVSGPTSPYTNQNLPINNSGNEDDYYDATERVGIAPDTSGPNYDACANNVTSIDGGHRTPSGGGSGNFYDADAGSHSLLHPDAGTSLSPGTIYTDSSSGLSYVWPNVAPCNYDLIDENTNSNGSTQTMLLPPNSGETSSNTTYIGFLGLGAGGSYSGNATITYADGSTESASLNSGDWCGSTPGGQTLVNSPKRSDGVICHVFQWADALAAHKVVTSITIPNSGGSSLGNMRIFSVSLALCSATSGCGSSNTKSFPELLWNHPADITYGTALGSSQLDATAGDVSGSIAGTFSYGATPAGTILNAGSEQTLSATFTPTDTTHWISGTTITTALTVLPASQSITFPTIPTHTFGDADFSPGATASSGLTVSYGASGNCTIVSGNVHITGAGSCTVTASQSGNSNYTASSNSPQQTFTISKANQSISFGSLPTHVYGDSPFTVSATGGASGNDVTFSIDGTSTVGACTSTGTDGATITMTGAGTCDVDANQAGNSNYNGATQIQQPFSINMANQSINFSSIPGQTYGDPPVTASATGGGSGNDVTFSIDGTSSPGACSSGGTYGATITITGAGTCVVDANQTGNGNYFAAPQAQQSFSIGPASLNVSGPTVGMPLGGQVPSFSPSYGPFQGSDNASSLTTAPTCSTTAGSTGTTISTVPPYSYPITCSGGVSGNYTFSYTAGTLTINTSAIAYNGDTTFTDGASGTLSATLTDAYTGNPVSGKSVTLTLAPALDGGQSCSGTTDSNGNVSCVLNPVTIDDGTRALVASFAGDSQYPAISTTTSVTVKPQPTDTLTYTGDTLMTNGTSATLSATLIDSNSVGISGRTISFTLAPSQNAQSCSGTTNSSGVASCTITSVNEPAGSRNVLVVYGGDTYAANSVNAPVTVQTGAQDTLANTGVTTIADGSNIVVSASLTNASTAAGISGDTLTFALAPASTDQTCTATTDTSGNASCTINSVSAPTGTRTLRVSFGGDGTYPANQTDTSVTVTPGYADTLSYTGPGTIVDQNDVVVTANISDANTLAGLSGESVTLTLAPALSNQSCTGVSDGSGNVSCTITDVSSADDGSRTLRVSFAGDGTYPANQVDSTVSVTAAAADTLTYTGASTGTNGSTIRFSATLTDPNNSNAPIVGDNVQFQLGPAQAQPATCSGTTDGTGTVACTTSALNMTDGARTLVMTFTGDGTYAYNQQTLFGAVTVSG